MSLLDEIYCVPSRVEGVVRLVATMPSRRMPRIEAEKLLSPDVLLSAAAEKLLTPDVQVGAEDSDAETSKDRDMVQSVMRECIGMRLLTELHADICLADDVPNMVIDRISLRPILAPLIRKRVFDGETARNHQFAKAISWYLTQDALSPPASRTNCQKALTKCRAETYLSLNDNNYQMLTYWGVYLGFARLLPLNGVAAFAPEPTEALRQELGELVRSRTSATLRIDDFVATLGAQCPAFEGGSFRVAAEPFGPVRNERTLSTTTSHALLSLEEQGIVTLTAKSDAPTFMLSGGTSRKAVSEITWHDNMGAT